MNRRGAVFLIVVGMCSLLLSLSIAFLVAMRRDGEESRLFNQGIQARAMVLAALQYLQEGSRIGWDRPETPECEEAFGWIDVRDGSPGPRDRSGLPLFDAGAGFPAIGGVARCAMHRLR